MLTGKQIVLRQQTLADQPQLTEWYNDPEYWGAFFNQWPTTLDMEQKYYTPPGFEHHSDSFVITRRGSGELLGKIGFFNPFSADLFHGKEIWYQVHPQFRRQGIGTQAACLLVNHLFNATAVNRLQATVVVGNVGSAGILEKAGFQREGVLRGIFFLDGRYQAMWLYALIRTDWGDEAHYRSGRAEF
jgi:RimJ/RimL family protein N-acetyltransferase